MLGAVAPSTQQFVDDCKRNGHLSLLRWPFTISDKDQFVRSVSVVVEGDSVGFAEALEHRVHLDRDTGKRQRDHR